MPPGNVWDNKTDNYSFQRWGHRAYLLALNTTAFGPLADHLTPVAGTELAARAVPHVTAVTHRTLVQAASLGGGAFITALTSTPHIGLTLRGSSTVRLRFAWRNVYNRDDGNEEMHTELWDKTKKIQGACKKAVFCLCVCVFQLRGIRGWRQECVCCIIKAEYTEQLETRRFLGLYLKVLRGVDSLTLQM